MKVLFDGTAISSDYIYELSKEHQLFNEAFRLGSVSARTYKLTIEKGVASVTPSVVITDDNDVNEAVLQVDNEEETDDVTAQYTLVDAMVNLSFNYDASAIVPTTTMGILQDICAQANLTLANESFDGDDIVVNFYDNTRTARDYVSYIAELNGGYAIINADGELELKKYSNTSVDTIAVEDCENFKLGEHHIIKRVVYDDASGTAWSYGDDEAGGDTLYLDINNPFIYSEEAVEAIYDSIVDFEYYCLSTDNCPIGPAVAGETITFTLGNESFPTIAQISQTCAGNSWFGGYSLDLATSVQEETKVYDAQEKQIRSIQTNINRIDNEFSRLVSETATKQELNTLTQTIKTNTTTLIQNASNIILEATQEQIDGLSGEITELQTEVDVITDGLKVSQNTEGSYVLIKDTGMEIYVEDQLQAYATTVGFKASAFLTSDWHIQPGNSGNSLNFFKKSAGGVLLSSRGMRRR